jgi:predicted transcriptional regulator of viral defense system
MMDSKLEKLFHKNGGQLRMTQIIEGGLSRSELYSLRDKGIIVGVSRGLYRLASYPEHREPDLCIVSLRYPKAVICLISALAIHDLTTQIPHEINIALPRGSRAPSITQPPVRSFLFSEKTYQTGIEEHKLEGVRVRVYDKEKTIIDIFRFRNKLGIDVFLEALKLYKAAGKTRPSRLMEYARICSIEKTIQPYLEAGL